jgi:hypothetical protein
MHNRILNGNSFSTRGVTIEAFQNVARQAGTMELPEVKRALDKLRRDLAKTGK